MSDSSLPRLVVVVTGANGGVGLGICQRLFRQVATQDVPVDVLPQVVQLSTTLKEKEKQGEVDGKRYGGLTLILACRSMARAEGAKRVLEEEVEATLRALCVQQQEQRRQRKGSTEAEGESSLSWRIRFCENTSVLIESLDLGSLQSVFSFASRLTRRLEAGEGLGSARSGKGKAYLTHLVLNAGINSHWKKDWVAAAKQFLTKGFVNATTAPRYMLQNVGEESGDGLGWVWQCNVFGHYVLAKTLEPLLSNTPFEVGRTLWCSSIEAIPHLYNTEKDWQLRATTQSYESSKWQVDLVASVLDGRARARARSGSGGEGQKVVRHLIYEPGVAFTGMSDSMAGNAFLSLMTVWMFYMVRWLGSLNHVITTYKSAVAPVHLILAPLSYLPVLADANIRTGWGSEKAILPLVTVPTSQNDVDVDYNGQRKVPTRFGSQADWWGREFVGRSGVGAWNEDGRVVGEELVQRMDGMVKEFGEKFGA